MYAIVKSGGHQYRVAAGDVIEVEHLDAEPGDLIHLDQVLLLGGDQPRVGAPLVAGARVEATVLAQAKSRKVVVFKYKNKNRYRIKTGHRQLRTRLRIEAIHA